MRSHQYTAMIAQRTLELLGFHCTNTRARRARNRIIEIKLFVFSLQTRCENVRWKETGFHGCIQWAIVCGWLLAVLCCFVPSVFFCFRRARVPVRTRLLNSNWSQSAHSCAGNTQQVNCSHPGEHTSKRNKRKRHGIECEREMNERQPTNIRKFRVWRKHITTNKYTQHTHTQNAKSFKNPSSTRCNYTVYFLIFVCESFFVCAHFFRAELHAPYGTECSGRERERKAQKGNSMESTTRTQFWKCMINKSLTLLCALHWMFVDRSSAISTVNARHLPWIMCVCFLLATKANSYLYLDGFLDSFRVHYFRRAI